MLQLVMFQGSSYCNLNCSYCYLSEESRKTRRRQSLAVVERTLDRILEAEMLQAPLQFLWHAGEPLTAGLTTYRQAFAVIRQRLEGKHPYHLAVQTNGTLVDAAWCELFREYSVQVGLSLDGPAFIHDAHRRGWRGEPTHARVMQTVGLFREFEIPFHIIGVLTPLSLDHADEIFDFYQATGCREFGFNVEEQEGVHQSAMSRNRDLEERFRRFMQRIFARAHALGQLDICREIRRVARAVGHLDRAASRGLTVQTRPFGILTVDAQGNFSSFSPELLTLKQERYGDFILGNVFQDSFVDVLSSVKLRELARDIAVGVEQCRKTCEYFAMCHASTPSNKLMENGFFESTETAFCRYHKQIVADVVVQGLYDWSQTCVRL